MHVHLKIEINILDTEAHDIHPQKASQNSPNNEENTQVSDDSVIAEARSVYRGDISG